MKEQILTLTSEKNNGKGSEGMIDFDKKYYIHELLNKNIDYSKYNVLICDFNEDAIRSNGTAKKHFKTLDKMLLYYEEICENALKVNPSIKIYQNPKQCSWIGDKQKTNTLLANIIKKEDFFALPLTTVIHNRSDIETIQTYPVIMKATINTGKERKLDCIVHSQKEAKQKYNEFFKCYKEIIAVEQIDSRISHLRCNHVIRLFIVNSYLYDWSIRPSSSWNIHVRNSIISKLEESEKYIEPIIKNNIKKIMSFIKKMHSILGNGFYAWDVIYSKDKNKLYICEIGLKYFDYFMANRVKGRFSKLCMDKKQMTNFYNQLFCR